MKAKTCIQVWTILIGLHALTSLPDTLHPTSGLALAADIEQLPLIEEDGHIDSLEGSHVVINDSSFTLTPTTLFLGTEGGKSERSSFTADTFVHYAANNQREIISLRHISQPTHPGMGDSSSTAEGTAPVQTPPPVKKTDKLIFENGVWHN